MKEYFLYLWIIIDFCKLYLYTLAFIYSRINKQSGELSLIGRAKQGSYDLNVKVYDRVWSRYVMSTVNVRIIDIPEEAIQNFASIRFQGII